MRLPWLLLLAAAALAQDFSHRGFLETRVLLYPQIASNDSGRAVAEGLFRYEAAYKARPWFRLAGAFDARTDSHRQTAREWDLEWQDRGRQRPAFAVRRLSAILNRKSLTAEVGKQFIRWGKADVLNPTDRFAPRDFLSVVDNDFLGVTAARLTWEATTSDTLDLVWQPRFTPSRIPLLNQRWVLAPAGAEGIPFLDAGAHFPGRSQFGARWNHVGGGFEHSLSFFEGFNHLPLFDGRAVPVVPPEAGGPPFAIEFRRFYPKMRMYGADAAVPLRWFTVKGEAAYFTSSTQQADQYLQYVVQLERQTGEWVFVGGYAGEKVTEKRVVQDFAPDRGLARALLGRASYTIDVNRRFAFEGAVRQNGDGVWLKFEYSQAVGQHWRATASVTVIRGEPGDFLGQYRRNSHGIGVMRYSF